MFFVFIFFLRNRKICKKEKNIKLKNIIKDNTLYLFIYKYKN